MDSKLLTLYEDNDFPGVNKLYQLAKRNKINATLADVKKFISSQKISQIYKKAPETKKSSNNNR